MFDLSAQYYGSTLAQWLGAVGIVIIALGVCWPWVRFLAHRKDREHMPRMVRLVGHLADQVHVVFLFVGAFYVAVKVTQLTPWGIKLDTEWLGQAFVVLLYWQCGLLATGLVRFILSRYRERREGDSELARVSVLNFIELGVRVAIWSIVFLLVVDSFGHDVTALIAGLGVGGIAIGLAVQNILGDLFASLTIVLDKPFVVGDFIIVDSHLGSVEHIGLKSTRIRSLSGEQLIFSNGDLLGSRIRNFKRMKERRVVFSLGVTYQTPSEKLKRIPGMVREIIEKQDLVRFDRAHFQKYGDFSLVFEIVYWVLDPDYTKYMDIQQAINLEIYSAFEEAGIEFAYPTQTVYLEHDAGGAADEAGEASS